ncbi:hypothetical protein MKW92_011972 [Papaver armeniacum]|nr:hypothetical protein MKW92_011972 [Papaver armeniacum]
MAERDVPASATGDLTNGSSYTATTKNVVKSRKTSGKGNFSLELVLEIQGSKAYEAIEFYKTAFGAQELKRKFHPTSIADQEVLASADLKIGSLVCSLDFSDQFDRTTATADESGWGRFAIVKEYESDDVVNGVVNNAVAAGAVLEMTEDGCYNGLIAKLNDPYGYIWLICSAKKKKKMTKVAAQEMLE